MPREVSREALTNPRFGANFPLLMERLMLVLWIRRSRVILTIPMQDFRLLPIKNLLSFSMPVFPILLIRLSGKLLIKKINLINLK